VLFLVPYPADRAPGQRYRVEQWVRLLGDGAVEATFRPLFDREAYEVLYRPGHLGRKAVAVLDGLGRRIADTVRVTRHDVVVLYREAFPIGPAIIERLVERRMPVVYDFDDAIFLGDTSRANRMFSALKQPRKVEQIVAGAAATTVSNEWLAAWARDHSSRVVVIPPTVDLTQHRPMARPPGTRVRIGWSGSPTTAAHLHTIDGALRRVLASREVELVVVGAPDYGLPGAANVVVRRWSPAAEVADLASFDIGVMPLPDDAWSRGKAGMKALLSMAMATPVVVSPIGANTDIVQDGVNGRHAGNEDEWVAVLEELVDDAALRRRLGQAGRATVEDRFSGQRWAPVFLDVLRAAADR